MHERLLDKLEELFDRMTYHLRKFRDFISELSGDIYRKVTQILVTWIGSSVVWFINAMMSAQSENRSRLITVPLRLIGIFLVVLCWICVHSFLIVYGMLGAMLGMRRGREYLFSENLMTWLPLILLAVVSPWIGLSDYAVTQMTLFLSYSVIVLGLNILLGIAGQPSLGHGAFVLMGSYVSVILFSGGFFGFPINCVLAIIIGGLFSGLFGFLIGYPAVKVRGPYLTLITLGLMISLSPILKHHALSGITGGTDGLSFEQPRPPSWLEFIPQSTWIYYLSLLFFIVMFVVAHILIRRTKFGRALLAIRDGEERTNVLGINEALYKALAFALSAFYGGVGGGVASLQLGYISPDSVSLHDSMDYLVAMVVGGRGSLFGSVVGGAFMTYHHVFVSWLTNHIHNGEQLTDGIYGAVLVAVMIFAPMGIAGAITHRLYIRRFSHPTRRKHRREVFPDYDLEEELLVVGSVDLTH